MDTASRLAPPAVFARIASGVTFGVGALVLVGSVRGITTLTGIVPGWPPMAPLTAVALILSSLSVGLAAGQSGAAQAEAHRHSLTRGESVSIGLAGCVALLSLIRLATHLFGWDLQLDSLGLTRLPSAAGDSMPVAKMSPATALAFVVLAGAVMLANVVGWTRAYLIFALLTVLLGWLGFAHYVYGGPPLVPYSAMAAHTALSFLLLGAATLALRPDVGLVALLFSGGEGGMSVRRLLPAAILVPLAAGALALSATQSNGHGAQAAVSLFALSSVVIFAGLVWAHAERLERTDIQRRNAQEALRSAEERTRLIIETALDAVITIDSIGTVTGWSEQAASLFGWASTEAIGQQLSQMIIPERYREAHHSGMRRYLASGVGSVLNRRIEISALRRDGHEFPVELAITPLHTGQQLAFSAFIRDITERKQAEARLRTQLEQLALLDRTTRAIGNRQDPHSILQVVLGNLEDNLPIDFGCVCLYHATHSLLDVTCVGIKSAPLALQLAMPEQTQLDIDQNGLSRCLGGQLVYEPDIAHSQFPFPKRLAAGGLGSLVIAPLAIESKIFGVIVAARRKAHQFSSSECEFLRQLGEHVALALHQAELYSALHRAYEDLRQTQQSILQQERLRALGQMASGIAHDINNALAPATLYVQSMLERDPSLSQEAKNYLVVIQRAIHDVAQTVARMKEFYRQGEPHLARTSVDLNSLLEQVSELTRARWNTMPQERGIVIQMQAELAPNLPAVSGTGSEIRDALTNLILNAVDAMPNGGTLTLRTRTIGTDQVSAEVIDTGIGMDETTRARCLEPFFTTKGERGTGLGLAMVYGMVERHGGELQIESEPGKGTVIRLIFPIAKNLAASSTGLFPLLQPSQSLRLLFVDDDPIMLKSMRDILEQDGHMITVAEGGQHGIDAFHAAQQRGEVFAAVITDLGMPHVDGRTVAAAVKAAAPQVPVILLTGWGHRILAENDLPPYVDRVLSKPPKLAALRLALIELTAGSAQ